MNFFKILFLTGFCLILFACSDDKKEEKSIVNLIKLEADGTRIANIKIDPEKIEKRCAEIRRIIKTKVKNNNISYDKQKIDSYKRSVRAYMRIGKYSKVLYFAYLIEILSEKNDNKNYKMIRKVISTLKGTISQRGKLYKNFMEENISGLKREETPKIY